MWPPGATTGPLVKLTNPDKVLYPATGTTKSEVFHYYTTIAELMLPHFLGVRPPANAGRTESTARRSSRRTCPDPPRSGCTAAF